MTTDALTALRKPFPKSEIGKLPKISCGACSKGQGKVCERHPKKQTCKECGAWITTAHIHLDYVGHAGVTNRLLDADPSWSWEPVAFDAEGAPLVQYGKNEAVMWVRLTVGGVTRLGVGSAPVGSFELHKQLISDAIRNASMRFGVALELWSKEPLPELVEQEPPPAAPKPPLPGEDKSPGGEPPSAAAVLPPGVDRSGGGGDARKAGAERASSPAPEKEASEADSSPAAASHLGTLPGLVDPLPSGLQVAEPAGDGGACPPEPDPAGISVDDLAAACVGGPGRTRNAALKRAREIAGTVVGSSSLPADFEALALPEHARTLAALCAEWGVQPGGAAFKRLSTAQNARQHAAPWTEDQRKTWISLLTSGRTDSSGALYESEVDALMDKVTELMEGT